MYIVRSMVVFKSLDGCDALGCCCLWMGPRKGVNYTTDGRHPATSAVMDGTAFESRVFGRGRPGSGGDNGMSGVHGTQFEGIRISSEKVRFSASTCPHRILCHCTHS